MSYSAEQTAVLVTPSRIDAPTGTERAAASVGAALSKWGYSVDAISPADGRDNEDFLRRGEKYWRPALDQYRLRSRLRNTDYSLSFSNGPVGAGIGGERRFHLFHGLYQRVGDAAGERLSRLAQWRYRFELGTYERLAGRGKVCLANSTMTARDVKRSFGYDCDVVWLEVDPDEFSPGPPRTNLAALDLPTDRQIGVFVGLGRVNKGEDVALEIARRFPEVHWLMIGDSPRSSHGAIQVRQRVDRSVMPDVYRAADFVLSPSRYEPFGLTVAEALVSATPVITTPTGATELLFRELDDCPLIVSDPDDVEGFARSVRWVLANPDDSRSAATSAREVAQKELAPEPWRTRLRSAMAV